MLHCKAVIFCNSTWISDRFSEMELFFDNSLAINYRSATQIARVMTESWVEKNMFCPRCGNLNLKHFENNRPVADFFCPVCNNEYELKSKNGIIGMTYCEV